MTNCCKAPPGRGFLLFQLFNIKTQKNTKNARILPYLCVYKFFHEQKKKHAFLQTKSWPKSPFISFEAEMSRTIFKSKKNEKKSAKNAFPVYGWASKSLQKWYILHAKSWLCCYVKITIFQLSRYTDGAKRVTKNHSFLTSKFMFFYVKNRYFHRSTCVDGVKKCTTDMHFSLKIDHFFIQKS